MRGPSVRTSTIRPSVSRTPLRRRAAALGPAVPSSGRRGRLSGIALLVGDTGSRVEITRSAAEPKGCPRLAGGSARGVGHGAHAGREGARVREGRRTRGGECHVAPGPVAGPVPHGPAPARGSRPGPAPGRCPGSPGGAGIVVRVRRRGGGVPGAASQRPSTLPGDGVPSDQGLIRGRFGEVSGPASRIGSRVGRDAGNGFGRSATDRVMSSSLAPIAQSVERLHGKEKVCGSIPHWGSGDRGTPLRRGNSSSKRCSSVGRASGS